MTPSRIYTSHLSESDQKANSHDLGFSSTAQGSSAGPSRLVATGSQGGGGGSRQHPSKALRAMQASQVRASQPIMVQHNVKVLGTGSKWVVFAHAFGDNQQVWMPVVNCLDLSVYRVVLYDQSGALGSDYDLFDEDLYGTLHGHTNDLLAILEELSRHHQGAKFVFVGHRQAGMIGLLASVKKPAFFQCMVLISSSPRLLDDKNYVGGYVLEDVAKALGFMESNAELWARNCKLVFNVDDFKEERLRTLTRRLFLLRPDVAFCLLRSTFGLDLREILPQVSVPTHILSGTQDAFVPLATAEYMQKALRQCTITMLEAQDLGHGADEICSCVNRAFE